MEHSIYILPVDSKFRAESLKTPYPIHNVKQRGVEKDFYHYLWVNSQLLTDDPKKARWHYLPVYWFFYWMFVCKKDKTWYSEFPELQKEVDRVIIDPAKTFTICQRGEGPIVNLGEAKVFISSRATATGYDIPLLGEDHPVLPGVKKKWLASFTGRIMMDEPGYRTDMVKSLEGMSDLLIRGWKFREPEKAGYQSDYVRDILEAYLVLCPRGYRGGSSFRFYEAMQLGVAPFLIGDIDNRPFKEFLDWSKVCIYSTSCAGLPDLLRGLNRGELLQMGVEAKKFFYAHLNYGKWCPYVLRTLEELL